MIPSSDSGTVKFASPFSPIISSAIPITKLNDTIWKRYGSNTSLVANKSFHRGASTVIPWGAVQPLCFSQAQFS